MQRFTFCLGLAILLVAIATGDLARAAGKEMKLTKEMKGSVADESKQAAAPDCVVSEKGLKKLWDEWKIAGKPPEVNFDKELVLVTTAGGSKLNLLAKLDDKGNVEVIGMGTLDIAPGFRYVMATVSRDGVKKVNGKELPKE